MGLDQIIVGGESGPGARSCDIAWIRSIVSQCKAEDVACFVKQLGAVPIDSGGPLYQRTEHQPNRVRDRKGGDPAEWPEDLRVRQMPSQPE